MSAKHTPGPWRYTSRNVDNKANWASRIPFAIEVEHGAAVAPIADICDQPQAEENARLIAAAPDLLFALKACAAVCAGEVMDKKGLINALELASSAIRKATGEAA